MIAGRGISGGAQLASSVVSAGNYNRQIGLELPEFIDGPSIYAYGRSEPTMYVDPSGNSAILFGPQLELTPGVGFGAGFGLAISFPTPWDPGAKWDIGVFGNISGRLGFAGGLSLISFNPHGSICDLNGASADVALSGSLGPLTAGFGLSAPYKNGHWGSMEWNASAGPAAGRTGVSIGGRIGLSGGLNFMGTWSVNGAQ